MQQRKRRFELLKDLPGIPKGTRTEEYVTITHEGRVEAFHITFIDCGDGNTITLDRRKCPDWVREIEEPEFTRQDMIEFGRRVLTYVGKYEHLQPTLNAFIEEKENKVKEPIQYKIGDFVLHQAASTPFEVVGIDQHGRLKLKGDWSNGVFKNLLNCTACVTQDTVKPCPKKQEAED